MLLVTPLIVFIVDPPLLNATPKAPMEAAKKLQAMGPLTEIEKRHVSPWERLYFYGSLVLHSVLPWSLLR